ncbi:hypothetical protein CTRC69_01820 [Chlamydia trachomatis RC-F/69]|nr:hypothetical protein CTLINITIAL_04895 [Chlamydia trachomatis L2/434/Bu(i)]AGO32826.1 hypothetical protein CTLFINAL_04900 [Chlamydia trachomatis L2/434/Bu(f)]AGR93764.1 hypothetical protein CTRC69_01820 [Chlamydia trachomatis RC-F/69]AGR94687.1 hypothetical protein CTRC46_01800 [Chlamydia trachomatis RC-L2(s)/46]AGR95607.1 hypothetical protein CTRC852_01840 [Chlamydia trachomatis RC-F(s)/852]AGR96567.1 hypothetical protein CTRC943_01790 [Chlamydia trachomatis RC-J/943]AGR98407.1 hypothetica
MCKDINKTRMKIISYVSPQFQRKIITSTKPKHKKKLVMSEKKLVGDNR